MLHLVYDDPHGWLRHYIKRRPVPNRAAKGTGFIYVLAITGPVSYVKVGSTAGPRARFEALRSEAHRVGSTVTRAWLSPAHPQYQANAGAALARAEAAEPIAVVDDEAGTALAALRHPCEQVLRPDELVEALARLRRHPLLLDARVARLHRLPQLVVDEAQRGHLGDHPLGRGVRS
jgi:hypothetical protein